MKLREIEKRMALIMNMMVIMMTYYEIGERKYFFLYLTIKYITPGESI